MFTGLIATIGTVEKITSKNITEVWIQSNVFDELLRGESIACDGVCLTAIESRGSSFKTQVTPETLRRSTLGEWTPGAQVNLERALRMGDRLGGHWVQGHVDGISRVLDCQPDGSSRVMQFSLSRDMAPFFVEKGSVCINGVSLTVNKVEAESFSVMLIPETQTTTTLGQKYSGALVNIEADLIGKYVFRMMNLRNAPHQIQTLHIDDGVKTQ